MVSSSFYVENTSDLINKICEDLEIEDIYSDTFFNDLKLVLKDLELGRPFLRFVKSQEMRLNVTILDSKTPTSLAYFIASCHYYFGY